LTISSYFLESRVYLLIAKKKDRDSHGLPEAAACADQRHTPPWARGHCAQVVEMTKTVWIKIIKP